MQARAPLMIEHRLVERMIAIIKRTLSQIEKEEKVGPFHSNTIYSGAINSTNAI
jgi:hypothetical protein